MEAVISGGGGSVPGRSSRAGLGRGEAALCILLERSQERRDVFAGFAQYGNLHVAATVLPHTQVPHVELHLVALPGIDQVLAVLALAGQPRCGPRRPIRRFSYRL